MSWVGMANSFKYIKVVIYLRKMRLKQKRRSVSLLFKRQAYIIPALIRFPEVQSLPGSLKFKKTKNQTHKPKTQQLVTSISYLNNAHY